MAFQPGPLHCATNQVIPSPAFGTPPPAQYADLFAPPQRPHELPSRRQSRWLRPSRSSRCALQMFASYFSDSGRAKMPRRSLGRGIVDLEVFVEYTWSFFVE